MYRTMEQQIRQFFETVPRQALMITGARQVGKTYTIRKTTKDLFAHVVEINFIENEAASGIFEGVTTAADILLRLSALTDVPMEPGKTLIFLV